MNERMLTQFLLVVVIALVLAGCKSEQEMPAIEPEVGLANPASVSCVEQGGTLEMREDGRGGTFGVCVFADGSECEEWAYFRGECQPGTGQQPTGSINPLETHRLDTAIRLEILESVAGEPATEGGQPIVIEIVPRLTVDDLGSIAGLVATLNDDLAFTSRARCPAQYTLIFTLADETVESFSYGCLNDDSAILWGDQVVWNVWAINAPVEFQDQFLALLARDS